MTWKTSVAAAALLALPACGEGVRRVGPVQVGDPAPAYAARTLEGERRSLADHRGRTVLLNVWATWCHPCREEIPALEALHEEYGARGLDIVGVSIDQGGQDRSIRDFLREYGASYAVWLDPGGEVQSVFGTIGVPSTYLIAPDGTVTWKHVGPVKADDPNLRRLIERALSEG